MFTLVLDVLNFSIQKTFLAQSQFIEVSTRHVSNWGLRKLYQLQT